MRYATYGGCLVAVCLLTLAGFAQWGRGEAKFHIWRVALDSTGREISNERLPLSPDAFNGVLTAGAAGYGNVLMVRRLRRTRDLLASVEDGGHAHGLGAGLRRRRVVPCAVPHKARLCARRRPRRLALDAGPFRYRG